MYVLFAILIFSVLIITHELGHFIVAKLCGVQVNEFSIFMGPKLFQIQGKETKYTLRCIPLGGYCAMEGEDENSENPRAFTSAKVWKRALILFAGAAANYLTGILVIFFLFGPHTTTALPTPVISDFFEGCPYESEEGLQVGDRFYSIDGHRIHSYLDASLYLERNSDEVYDLVMIRDGEKVTLNDFSLAKIDYETEEGTETKIGIYFGYVENTFTERVKYAWNYGLYFTNCVVTGLQDLISGAAGFKDMGGAVQIVSVMAESGESAATVSDGISNVLFLGAFIAVNLAVMNLLPIPALDGGRIFCLLLTWVIETVTRKKINPKYEAAIHGVGMVLLLLLMVVMMFKDIITLIR